MEHKLEEVFTWLEAGAAADYRAGVLVLQNHCRNRNLVNGLLKKESPANREKLVYELVKIGCDGRLEDVSEVLNHFALAVQGAVPVAGQVVEVLNLQPEQLAPVHVPDELQPQLDELTQRMGKLHNQRVQLSNSLADLSEAEVPAVVAQILTLQEQYNELAQQRGNVVAGEPTAPEQPAPEAPTPGSEQAAAPSIDRAELMKKRNGLRSNLSKAKKKAEESKTEEKRSEYAQKAAKLAVELDQVELQLKA